MQQVIPQQLRSAGSLTTPTVDIGGLSTIKATINILSSDKTNVSKQLSWQVFVAQDGVNFQNDISGSWVGGSFTNKDGTVNPDPFILVSYDNPLPVGSKMFVIFTIPQSITAGLTITAT